MEEGLNAFQVLTGKTLEKNVKRYLQPLLGIMRGKLCKIQNPKHSKLQLQQQQQQQQLKEREN